MGISDYKYTFMAKGDLTSYRPIKIGNIKDSYAKPAWRHTVEYDKSAVEYYHKNKSKRGYESISGYKGVSYARYLIIDVDQKGQKLDHVIKNTWLSLEAFRQDYDIDDHAIQIYFSGKKGLHIHLPTKIFGLKPVNNLPKRLLAFVDEIFGGSPMTDFIDRSIFQYNQQIRLPNTPHQETGRYKIPISLTELATISQSELKGRAQKPVPVIKYRTSEFHKNNALSSIWNKIASLPAPSDTIKLKGVIDSKRHDELLKNVQICRSRGMLESEAVEHLFMWDSTNKPPMYKHNEIRSTVKNWYEKTAGDDFTHNNYGMDPHRGLTSILTHSELTIEETGILVQIYHRVNLVEKEWLSYKIQPGSGVFTHRKTAAELGVKTNRFTSFLNRMKDLGLLYVVRLPRKRGSYITLCPHLRKLKVGQTVDLETFQLPPLKKAGRRWETRPRFINIRDVGWDDDDQEASDLDTF